MENIFLISFTNPITCWDKLLRLISASSIFFQFSCFSLARFLHLRSFIIIHSHPKNMIDLIFSEALARLPWQHETQFNQAEPYLCKHNYPTTRRKNTNHTNQISYLPIHILFQQKKNIAEKHQTGSNKSTEKSLCCKSDGLSFSYLAMGIRIDLYALYGNDGHIISVYKYYLTSGRSCDVLSFHAFQLFDIVFYYYFGLGLETI